MKNAVDQLKPFDEEKNWLNAVVETPKGSPVKYTYDPKTGLFRLGKALPAGMVFPFNFGFIPNTKAEDGDPMDILILNEESLVCGCLLGVRLIAVIRAKQLDDGQWIRNDRAKYFLYLATQKSPAGKHR